MDNIAPEILRNTWAIAEECVKSQVYHNVYMQIYWQIVSKIEWGRFSGEIYWAIEQDEK